MSMPLFKVTVRIGFSFSRVIGGGGGPGAGTAWVAGLVRG